MVSIGDKAPDFKLKDKSGTLHQLYSLKAAGASAIVLYFYPKDDTPGCTIEANEFNQHLQEFENQKIKVIGISGGDERSKTKFCDKYQLQLLLLSDTDFSISKQYGVYGEKSFMGRKYLGINRVTFILDPKFKVVKVFDKVQPTGHALEVLTFIKQWKEHQENKDRRNG